MFRIEASSYDGVPRVWVEGESERDAWKEMVHALAEYTRRRLDLDPNHFTFLANENDVFFSV